MGNIQVLSFEVANLIAAGEVVDRPASAVKEMMENAIDAGARHITVEIQNGGVSFMRVTDDGCGMSAEDLPMAIRRHATSKIRDAADLDGILTLGFRGEALAAISSVSDMRIMSKRPADAVGALLEVQGGTFLGVREFGCRDGTTVIVEHLFANVPARRKFLKRDVTEAMAVSANVERVALSHPEIAVRFISDGTMKLDTAGDGKLQSAIYAVFGRDFSSRLISLEGETDGIRVTGYIGRSDNVKSNRNGQNFFINHRYIKSRTAQAALEQAFLSYLPPEKYPCCVMFIDINPARVDVNVHPAKLEVKFSNEKPVYEAVYYAVRQALEQNTTRPTLEGGVLKPAFGATHPASGGRLSDRTTPIETERPEALRRRQITMDSVETATGRDSGAAASPAHGTDRISAEEYVAKYVRGEIGTVRKDGSVWPAVTGGKTSPAYTPPLTPTEQNASSAGDIPSEEGVPMEVYEAEAGRMSGTAPTIPPETTSAEHDIPPMPEPPVAGELPMDVSVAPSEPPMYTGASPDLAVPEEAAGTSPALTDVAPAPWRILGEVFHTYILVEQGDRLLLIDKHAAHERIIFEGLKANLKNRAVDSQLMLFPIDVMLMSEEVGMIDTYHAELEAIGFSFTCLRNTVRVDALPSGIRPAAVQDMFSTFAEQLGHGTGDPQMTRDALFEKALYQASCKAAIKAGREYPPEQEAWVVEQLMKIPDITFCPHGRPVAMEMSKRTLDHQFERC